MFIHTQGPVAAAEKAASSSDVEGALAALRKLSLDEFGEFFLGLPNPAYPALSDLLPHMASDDNQRAWTGNAGVALLKQSLTFARTVSAQYTEITQSGLTNKTILDYGCGYGRIARLMYYHTSPENIWGVDPMERSIEICREDRMLGHFALSDYLPRTLPVGDTKFDFIYSFSVFTHLSKRATLAALRVLRDCIKPDGVLVITLRPVEYWDAVAGHDHNVEIGTLLQRHNGEGFAFTHHNLPPVDGDITYGDTSMTFEWLTVHAPQWRVLRYDRTLDDPLQAIVYLLPA